MPNDDGNQCSPSCQQQLQKERFCREVLNRDVGCSVDLGFVLSEDDRCFKLFLATLHVRFRRAAAGHVTTTRQKRGGCRCKAEGVSTASWMQTDRTELAFMPFIPLSEDATNHRCTHLTPKHHSLESDVHAPR